MALYGPNEVRLGLPYMVGVRIVCRVCYGDCYRSRCSVGHSGDHANVVTLPRYVPDDGVTVEQHIEDFLCGRVHRYPNEWPSSSCTAITQ